MTQCTVCQKEPLGGSSHLVSRLNPYSYKWNNPTYPTEITGDLLPTDDPPGTYHIRILVESPLLVNELK